MSSDWKQSLEKEVTDRFEEAQEELVLQSADLALRTLTGMVASGAIDTSPNFQRRDRWDLHRQSALIESFFLNIPVPPIYLAEDQLGTYAVIDGKQRITAIKSYLNNEYALRFETSTRWRVRLILQRSLRQVEVPKLKSSRRDCFATGLPLSHSTHLSISSIGAR